MTLATLAEAALTSNEAEAAAIMLFVGSVSRWQRYRSASPFGNASDTPWVRK
jgi:hypothetical protein